MSSPIIGSSESSGDENRDAAITVVDNKPQFKTVLEAAAAPRPRLCHLKKWPHFQGYGFNLHAEKSKLSQHIGKVDHGSPAESAGLREGDRIIEVNNVNISNENHQQVVKRIRNGLERDGAIHDDEVLLLVIDRDGEDYYRNMNVVIKSDFDNVIQLKTADPPPIQPASAIQIDEKGDESGEQQPIPSPRHKKINSPSLSSSSVSPRSDIESPSKHTAIQPQAQPQPASTSSLVMSSSSLSSPSSTSSKTNTPNPNSTTTSSSSSSKASTSKINNRVNANNNSIASSASTVSINTPTTTTTTTSRANNKDNSIGSTLIQDPYKMTASEFKNYLKSKSRVDPRVTPLDMRRKHEIFQNM